MATNNYHHSLHTKTASRIYIVHIHLGVRIISSKPALNCLLKQNAQRIDASVNAMLVRQRFSFNDGLPVCAHYLLHFHNCRVCGVCACRMSLSSSIHYNKARLCVLYVRVYMCVYITPLWRQSVHRVLSRARKTSTTITTTTELLPNANGKRAAHTHTHKSLDSHPNKRAYEMCARVHNTHPR